MFTFPVHKILPSFFLYRDTFLLFFSCPTYKFILKIASENYVVVLFTCVAKDAARLCHISALHS